MCHAHAKLISPNQGVTLTAGEQDLCNCFANHVHVSCETGHGRQNHFMPRSTTKD